MADSSEAWEVGWDSSLGAFFAQPVTLDEDLTVLDTGTRVFEPSAFDRLGDIIGRPIPADIAHELYQDALTFPPNDPDPSPVLADWAASIYRQLGIVPRWSLPAAPVVDLIYEHRAEWGNVDLGTVASGMGLDRHLIAGMLDGSIQQLSVQQIGQVCEALRCSPFDLWGTDLGRSILHVYGPEHWPSYIEPIRENSHPHLTVVSSPDASPAAPDDPRSPTLDGLAELPGDTGILTPYRWAELVPFDAEPAPASDIQSADEMVTTPGYYLRFKQAADPSVGSLPTQWVSEIADTDAVPPLLTSLADAVREDVERFSNGAVTLLRVSWATGDEAWLGWSRPTRTWELWSDPRELYPGPHGEVFAPGPFEDPETWRAAHVAGMDGPNHLQVLDDAHRSPFAPGSDVIVTGYRQSGLLAVDDSGHKLPLAQASPAGVSEYHYTFEQVTRPSIYALFGYDPSSAGDGVNPFLASVATYRVQDADTGGTEPVVRIDMVRISPTNDGKFEPGEEAWLGWNPEARAWQLWDDPRRHYGGSPVDVLDPGRHATPEQWDATAEMQAINAHDTHGLAAIGIDDTALNSQEWTEKWAGEPLDPPYDIGPEL